MKDIEIKTQTTGIPEYFVLKLSHIPTGITIKGSGYHVERVKKALIASLKEMLKD